MTTPKFWTMKRQRRTPAQREFDFAKHGWAFCDGRLLRGRVERLEQLAARLDPSDGRHEELRRIREKSR